MPNDSSIYPPELVQFGRSIDLLGQDGFERLQSAFVVIVGLGGVGCHAASALGRSGLGRMRLIDIDELSVSSLNRHNIGTLADVGTDKVQLMADHLKAVNPEIVIEPVKDFFHDDSAERLLAGSPDLVIDAIDSFNPKVALLRQCVARGLPVISSMGASAHRDPSKIEIADISETRVCPLARVVRRRLKKLGIDGGIPTVYSTETPMKSLEPDLSEETFCRGRHRRRLPSLGVMPGIFGYALASMAMERICGKFKD